MAGMSDMKRIIDGLEETASYFHRLQSIGFFGDQPVYYEHEQHCNDAIALLKKQDDEIYALQVDVASATEYAEGCAALLKEQETVKPVKKDMVEITARYEYDCQRGAPLLIGQPYCADCGRRVQWDG